MKKYIYLLTNIALVVVGLVAHTAQATCVKDGFCDRPIQMGVSISNTPSSPAIYAGTAGMRVRPFGNPNLKLILSNNHVLGAVGPDLCPNTADGYPAPMTWTVQPGSLDLGFDPGNDPAYVAGLVFRYVPIDFTPGARNRVDAAVAVTTPSYASDEILGLGEPNPILGTATVGMPVTKSGRTTGVTTGTVLAVNSTVSVSYGSCGTATFEGQVITTAGLGASGDSGSVVLEQVTNTPVGLYFAGSAFSGIMNPILDVYTALRVFVDADQSEGISTMAELQQKAASMPVDARIRLLKQIQKRHETRLLSVPGVSGVGIGMDEAGMNAVLVVFCEKLTAKVRTAIPSELEGVQVRLIESGVFVAH
jgi:hypothetical protein